VNMKCIFKFSIAKIAPIFFPYLHLVFMRYPKIKIHDSYVVYMQIRLHFPREGSHFFHMTFLHGWSLFWLYKWTF
jgi:hypothetical protein